MKNTIKRHLYLDGDRRNLSSLVSDLTVLQPDVANGMLSEDDPQLPLDWFNAASIELDASEDAVKLSVSIGDPRGAFVFTVRRMHDGSLIMHVPYVGMPQAHMPLAPMHDGTLYVGHGHKTEPTQ